MKYRIKKNQILRKKLDIPKDVYERLYNGALTLREFSEHNLLGIVDETYIHPHWQKYVNIIGLENISKIDDFTIFELREYDDILLESIKGIEPNSIGPLKIIYDNIAKNIKDDNSLQYNTDMPESFKIAHSELFIPEKLEYVNTDLFYKKK